MSSVVRVKSGLLTAAIVPLLVFASPAAAQTDTDVTSTDVTSTDVTSTDVTSTDVTSTDVTSTDVTTTSVDAPPPDGDTPAGAPEGSSDGTDTTTSATTTSATPTSAATTTEATTTTTSAPAGGGVSGPAIVRSPSGDRVTLDDAPAEIREITPERGTQKQIVPPPPPPSTLAPWDPFRIPANSGSGRRAVYSKSQQTVWAFDSNNQLIKQHRVSGRQTPLDPRPGIYRVWSRSRYTYSINNPSITWGYMVRFAKGAQGGNIGFHEIPFQYGRPVQSLAQLGQPLSGGCVRQALPDAQWMWSWAQLGTLVVVTP